MNATGRSMFGLCRRRLVGRKLPNPTHVHACNRNHKYSSAALVGSLASTSSSFCPDSALHVPSEWRSFSSAAAPPQRIEHNYQTECSPKVEKVFEKILDLDMFEVHLVTGLIAEKVGLSVNAAAMAAGGAAGAGGGGGAVAAGGAEEEAAEEKTAFDLKLVSFDAKAKIKVIKEVRSIAGLGLKEAKEMVEGAPKTILKEMKKEELEEIAAKMKELGAEVEIV